MACALQRPYAGGIFAELQLPKQVWGLVWSGAPALLGWQALWLFSAATRLAGRSRIIRG